MLYRTQVLYKKVKNEDFPIYPICVPSYNRENPLILKALDTYPDLPIILFIRNTKEQKALYKKWRDRCKIVLLPEVDNIGNTRRAIVSWCVDHKISKIFMMDDDIDELDFLYPHPTKNGTICMRAARQNMGREYKGINPFTLRMWMRMLDDARDDLTLASPAYRPDSWHMKNKDADLVYNNGACIQCVYLNVKNLYKAQINYRDTENCGNEDYALQFDIMSKGLTTAVFHDLMYGCPAVGSLEGGNEDACRIKDIKARYEHFIECFLKNVSQGEHEGIKIAHSKSNIPSIKFNWKYWRLK